MTKPFAIEALEVVRLVHDVKAQGILSNEDLAAFARDIKQALPPHMRTDQTSSASRAVIDRLLEEIIEAHHETKVLQPKHPPRIEEEHGQTSGDRELRMVVRDGPASEPSSKARNKGKRQGGKKTGASVRVQTEDA